MKLLDTTGGNTKVKKSMKLGEVRIASLSLMPTIELCPHSLIANCFDKCLKFSGLAGVYASVNDARAKKTEFFLQEREAFMAQLKRELHNFIKVCKRDGLKPVVRLNVLSDVKWETLLDMAGEFSEIFFYDYTKNAKRLGATPENYKLMFSYSGEDRYQKHVEVALKTKVPMTVVFYGKELPDQYLGRPVKDGDVSDLDNVLSGEVIIGLRAKGNDAKVYDPSNKFIVDASNLITMENV